jgi:hypothetical protein
MSQFHSIAPLRMAGWSHRLIKDFFFFTVRNVGTRDRVEREGEEFRGRAACP